MSRESFAFGLTKRQHQTLAAAMRRAEAGSPIFNRTGRPRRWHRSPVFSTSYYPPRTAYFLAMAPKSWQGEAV